MPYHFYRISYHFSGLIKRTQNTIIYLLVGLLKLLRINMATNEQAVLNHHHGTNPGKIGVVLKNSPIRRHI